MSGIPWQFSGYDSLVSLLRLWVQFLVTELRSYKPNDVAKKKKRQNLCQSDFTAGNNINKLKELSMLLDIFLDKILPKNVKRKPVLKRLCKMRSIQ